MRWLRKAVLVACLAAAGSAGAVSLEDLKDPEDGRLDASRFLLDLKGFLPVPIIVTEPAVGYGGGAALVFFRRNEPDPSRRFTPPDITAVAGLGTENGSKAGGVGHLGFSSDRNWRYVAAAGKSSANLELFGEPLVPGGPREDGLGYNLDVRAVVGDVRRRVGDSEWFAGLRYLQAEVKSRFDAQAPASLEPRLADTTLAGLALVVEYDGRDNIFTPNEGTRLTFRGYDFAHRWGGDESFRRYEGAVNHFWNPAKPFVVGGRLDYRAVTGDAPFYTRPFISQRGIPAMRYQGDRTAVAEVEARWDVDARWSAVAFAGGGWAWRTGQGRSSTPYRGAAGVGFRYLLARQLGLRAGVDLARGPEKGAIYLTVGSAWR